MIYAIIIALVAFVVGWFTAPLALILHSGNCTAESLFIYDEPYRTVVSQARWYTHNNANEHYYQATLMINENGKQPESVISHRTINTSFKIHNDSVTLHTDKTFRIAGPKVSDPKWGPYIDPLAEEGYTNRIYLFRTESGRKMVGYKNMPISTCLNEN